MRREGYVARVRRAVDDNYREHVGMYLDVGFERMDGDDGYAHFAQHFWVTCEPYVYGTRQEAEDAADTFGNACGHVIYEFEVREYVSHDGEHYVKASTPDGGRYVGRDLNVTADREDAAYFGSHGQAADFMCRFVKEKKWDMPVRVMQWHER